MVHEPFAVGCRINENVLENDRTPLIQEELVDCEGPISTLNPLKAGASK